MQILITGREQDLSIAEAESKFGEIEVLNSQAIAIKQDDIIDIDHLGGVIKTAKTISKLTAIDATTIVESCVEYITSQSPQTKFNFGISSYGLNKINVFKLGLLVKNDLQRNGLKPRLVRSAGEDINAASIKHNKLTTSGYELLLVGSESGIYLARTTSAQDVDNYSKRDYEKPCRDSKVGMLPPKLSQIIINLTRPDANTRIVDPFCGSGGLLIEASFMGLSAEGSDIKAEMIECSRVNSQWFNQEFPSSAHILVTNAADATTREYPKSKYTIATEGYLGENFSSQPSQSQLDGQIEQLKSLYINLFKHLNSQPTKPTAVCICVPFWQIDSRRIEIDIIDDIINLGYTKPEFKSVRSQSLEYRREGQYTGRQILIFFK